MDREAELLTRITTNPEIFGGKPIIRGRRLAVEHVLGMLAAGDAQDVAVVAEVDVAAAAEEALSAVDG